VSPAIIAATSHPRAWKRSFISLFLWLVRPSRRLVA
jgi:hypothetical protein